MNQPTPITVTHGPEGTHYHVGPHTFPTPRAACLAADAIDNTGQYVSPLRTAAESGDSSAAARSGETTATRDGLDLWHGSAPSTSPAGDLSRPGTPAPRRSGPDHTHSFGGDLDHGRTSSGAKHGASPGRAAR